MKPNKTTKRGKEYRQGQVNIFNRLWDVMNEPDNPALNKNNNMLLKMMFLVRELNRIHKELTL